MTKLKLKAPVERGAEWAKAKAAVGDDEKLLILLDYMEDLNLPPPSVRWGIQRPDGLWVPKAQVCHPCPSGRARTFTNKGSAERALRNMKDYYHGWEAEMARGAVVRPILGIVGAGS